MLFNSFFYIWLFLPTTVIVYYYLARNLKSPAAIYWLLISSIFFYGWWNINYVPLLLGSATGNYLLGSFLSNSANKNKKFVLGLGILFNLLLLGYYKYTNFFIGNINQLTHSQFSIFNLILPLGISFFTFTQIAFLMDCYSAKIKEFRFHHYLLFVTFFPHLLAGPIIHHAEMMPQFMRPAKQINYGNMLSALFLFAVGLFKKVVIADTFAIWATQGFDTLPQLDLITAWQTSLSYTFQIYFDFSGYSDMAIASALFFNIKFPHNFFSPYKSTNIQCFWQRWHITLGRFLKDYLYIPLGGNRLTISRTHANLMITFILGGFWHGANWTFIFWGFLHGFASIIYKVWQSIGLKLHPIIAWFIMFNFINITWIFFRAKTWSDAMKVLQSMFDFQHIGAINPVIFACIMIALIICLALKNSMQFLETEIGVKTYSPILTGSFLTASMIVLSISTVYEFLYFQF